MRKLKSRLGFTLAELMMVVAIIGILAGVSFISVANYMRAMAQLERDGIAKEIFVAAQNHLTMAEGQGFLGVTDFGTQDSSDSNVYYFVSDHGNGNFDETSMLERMLPFGSVDETVRLGGNFVIKYQRKPALVLDVFYCSAESGDARYGYDFNSYSDTTGYDGSANKGKRRNYKNNKKGNASVLGWFGGDKSGLTIGEDLLAPQIEVENKERLVVHITNPNSTNTAASLQLIIKGLSSGAYASVELDNAASIDYILDDITSAGNKFAEKFAASNSVSGIAVTGVFAPGENITVEAVAYCKTVLANIAYSGAVKTNSLFADIDITGTSDATSSTTKESGMATAHIENFRHLENLSSALSGVVNAGPGGSTGGSTGLRIDSAEQTTDLDWEAFKKAINEAKNPDGSFKGIYAQNGNSPVTEEYFPVVPGYSLSYNGANYSISNVIAKRSENAGLFGTLSYNSEVKDLELIDFNIESTAGNAGALAGSLTGGTASKISNVLARNTGNEDSDAHKIKAAKAAGGLIGLVYGDEITGCAAALYVEGGEYAGGLIGQISGEGAKVTSSYAGGHTDPTQTGVYSNIAYNVTSTSGVAGGLIGDVSSATVDYSYSTCSVSGDTAGGLVGKGSGTITKCYATGLVKGASGKEGAFSGTGSVKLSGCWYYEIINERAVLATKTSGEEGSSGETESTVSGYEYLAPVAGTDPAVNEIRPLDSMSEYDSFVTVSGIPARPYDTKLFDLYQGTYFLKSVADLENTSGGGTSGGAGTTPDDADVVTYYVQTHYGDWPAPEIFVVNSKS